MYICHPQTDCFVVSQLFSVIRHVGRFKLELKPAQLYVRLSILPLNQQVTYVSSGFIRHYVVASFVYILPYRMPERSIHWKSFELRKWQPLIPLAECSPHPTARGSVYIVIQRQTVAFYRNFSV